MQNALKNVLSTAGKLLLKVEREMYPLFNINGACIFSRQEVISFLVIRQIWIYGTHVTCILTIFIVQVVEIFNLLPMCVLDLCWLFIGRGAISHETNRLKFFPEGIWRPISQKSLANINLFLHFLHLNNADEHSMTASSPLKLHYV